MMVAERAGIPLGVHITSASPGEITLVEETLAAVKVLRKRGGAPRRKPKRLIADKAYDADWLRISLWSRGIELICPHRSGRKRPPLQDGCPLRRYTWHWIVERTIAWLQDLRRIVVRWDRYPQMYLAFVHVACLLITARQL